MKRKSSAAQEAAIMHGKGPAMVLAGPGSGKTYVITNRLKYLIEILDINPSQILIITFTKAAAEEMKQRAVSLLGNTAASVTFGTFHAVFFFILRHTFRLTSENIIRNDTRNMIIRDIIRQLDIESNDPGVLMQEMVSEISRLKNTGDIQKFRTEIIENDVFMHAYEIYSKRMKDMRLLDFDDMLIKCCELFKKYPEVLKTWQKKYSWIQIDEFQDINDLQYEVIKMLAAPENNLFIVGDDDQAIYGFRGSKPGIMQNFAKEFNSAAVYELGMNYRSVHRIVETASELISNNKDRLAKNISAFNMTGEEVDRKLFEDREEETEAIIKYIRSRTEDCSLDSFAVLTRTNQLAGFFAEQFMAAAIPYSSCEKINNIYETFIASDILDYCRIADGDHSRSIFYRIMNRPQRFISRNAVPDKEFSFEYIRRYHHDSLSTGSSIERLKWDMDRLAHMKPYAGVHFILYGIGYIDYLKKYAAEKHSDADKLINTALEIRERSKQYNSYKSWFRAIDEFTASLSDKEKKGSEENSVKILTLHGSKGLEYPEVFIPDINEGVIPYHKAVLESEIEEERRLLYVGMTRAEKKLHLFSIKTSYGKNMQLSRFIEDIDKAHSLSSSRSEDISSNSSESRNSSKASVTFS